jgi:uncharacterized protein (TIGR03067 family)
LNTHANKAGLGVLLAIALIGCAGGKPSGPAARSRTIPTTGRDDEKLRGDWLVISAERDGASLPAEEIKGWKVSFNGPTMTLRFGSDAGPGIIQLAEQENPKGFIYYPKSGALRSDVLNGIYKLESDQLTMCWRKGGEAPTTFSSKGDNVMLIVCKPD